MYVGTRYDKVYNRELRPEMIRARLKNTKAIIHEVSCSKNVNITESFEAFAALVTAHKEEKEH